ncbi:MAG TPA: FAD-dependent thymidylate synthase [Deinococcales bacterium]|nr:FAD-dependent thymidylate synthase [Deinococcales bacterium]
MRVKLVSHTPDPLTAIYAQARMTTTRGDYEEIYSNKASTARKVQLVTDTLNSGHWSVSRGVSFTFSIAGVSRACGNQLVRHVQGVAWEQQSQRYKKVDTSEDWHITPPSVLASPEALAEYERSMQASAAAYARLLELGVAGEDARMVLPNAARTNLVSTWSFEALRNFLGQRLCTRAQWEIREVAKRMRKEVITLHPWASPFLTIKCIPLGLCVEHNPGDCPLLEENGGRIVWKRAPEREKTHTGKG